MDVTDYWKVGTANIILLSIIILYTGYIDDIIDAIFFPYI